MILYRATKKVVHYLCECILLCCDYIYSIKEFVALFLRVYSHAVIICWRTKKVVHYFFECMFICYEYLMSIKESVTLFFMYISLLWLYTEHEIAYCTIYLNLFYCSMDIWRAAKKILKYCFEMYIYLLCIFFRPSNKVLYYLFVSILLYYDSIKSIKNCAALFIWIYIVLLWLFGENQRRCCTFCFNVHSANVILRRAQNETLHHLFECIILFCYSRHRIKEGFEQLIWMCIIMLWYYAEY